MAANQKRNFKVKHAKPSVPAPPCQHPTVRAPPAPTSEQLLESLRNAILTTNEIVGGGGRGGGDSRVNHSNAHRNGSFDPPDGARVRGEPWSPGVGGCENHLIPPPGIFSDDEDEGVTPDWRLEVNRVPEGVGGGDVLLLPPPEEFDVDGVSESFVCSSDGGRVGGSGLSGDEIVLPPPAVFDNGAEIDGCCMKDGVKNDEKLVLTNSGEGIVTGDHAYVVGREVEGLPGVVTVVPAAVALPGVALASGSVGGVEMRRGGGEVEGKIIGGLFSVREICALIENDRMFVLQGVMDEECSDRRLRRKSDSTSDDTVGKLQLKQVPRSKLEPKPVSASSSTEKLELKTVSASSSTDKLQLRPVSASSSTDKLQLKPVSASSSTEKLQLRPVSASSSTEKLQLKPVSASSSTEKLQLKPVSASSSTEKLQLRPVSASSSTEKLQLKPVSASSSTENLELKPVSASSSTEKLQLKPVSASSSTEKLELKPVSVSSSLERLEEDKPVLVAAVVELKPVSDSLTLNIEDVENDTAAEKAAAADAVTMETTAVQDARCHGDAAKGPSSLKRIALDAAKKLQVAGKIILEREITICGTVPAFHVEGNTSAACCSGELLSESKGVDDDDVLHTKLIPGISADDDIILPSAGSCITTDAPKAPNANHAAPPPVAAGSQTAEAATPVELDKTTAAAAAADLERLSPDPDIAPPDPDKMPPYPDALEDSKTLDYDNRAVSLESGVRRVDGSTTTPEPVSPAINTGESESDARGSAGAVGLQRSAGEEGGASATAAVERNPKPESIVKTHLWSDTAVARVLNVSAGISTDLRPKTGGGLLLCETGVTEIRSSGVGREEEEEEDEEGTGKWRPEGSSSTDNEDRSAAGVGRVACREKRKMEVMRVDVTESMEQTENERHFISKTVTTTMTQETRSAAVGTPPPSSVGMAANSGARPKTGSMFAAGSDGKMESAHEDGKESKESMGLLGELRKNKPGIEGLKETSVAVEKGADRATGGRVPAGKQSSVFDMLLDQRELKSDRNSWSVFERREASRHQTETSSIGAVPAPLNITTSEFNAFVPSPSPSSPIGASANAPIASRKDDVPSVAKGSPALSTASSSPTVPPSDATDFKDDVSVAKESPRSPPPPTSASSPSPALSNRVTERKEEVVRVPRPTSLMVRPGKPPRHSISHPSTPTTTHLNATETSSHATTTAPLATPEECFDDVPCSNRSRQSSVGPSRSRQSSVGPCRSRQSSIGSLLGYQLPPSGVLTHFVVVAIDFGTTYSGYAFSFTRDPESIHMMRRWEGGDPGIVNQKTPTTLLLSSDGKFHSFGFAARDFYHDLDAQEAKKWLYFEKFKMALHHNAELNKETTIKASNGKPYPALSVFSHALTFFKDHALQELSDQSSTTILNEDIRWVITVPAIWKAPAKQFMRQAAYQAGIASADNPNQLLIALEPEAASIYVRKLRLYQLMPDPLMTQLLSKREPTPDPPLNRDTTASDDEFATVDSVKYKTLPSSSSYRHSISPLSTTTSVGQEVEIEGTNYMVVDCGGGTVDITVYEMESGFGHLKELHKATGGPYGSLGIDLEFEKLLIGIFGSEFIEAFRTKRPAGWVDLLIAFESRKRTASPFKNNHLNVSLPFSFIDYYKKYKGSQVESAIRKYGNKEVTWSSQGMLRLTPTAMRRLFQPTLDHIKQAIGDVLNNPTTRDIKYMFLVGGFAESAILQMEMRKEFEHLLRILIPQDVGLTILKGAVCFGLDPTIVSVRRSRMTYGVGVLNRFVPDKHPRAKMITKDGAQWCTDVFDKFVEVDQSVAVGETVVRSYAPAKAGQKSTIIHIYSSEKLNPLYITDPGVKRCGTLCLDLTDVQYRHSQKPRRREIQARMTFGDTEIKVTALDVATGKCVRAAIDFMNK